MSCPNWYYWVPYVNIGITWVIAFTVCRYSIHRNWKAAEAMRLHYYKKIEAYGDGDLK